MPDLTSLARAEALRLGADVFGVAPADRFSGAPEGFHPRDAYADARSVAVFGKRLPSEVMFARSCVPYTHANELLLREVDDLALRLSLWLEDAGVRAVLVPSDDPYEAWDAARQHGQGIISMRHAAELGGLGRIGRSNLLINDRFGNLLQLGAVLVAEELEPSALAAYEVCPEGCSRCIDACPARALDGRTVRQRDCRPLSNFRTEKGYVLKRCWECRKVCPSALGVGRDRGRSARPPAGP